MNDLQCRVARSALGWGVRELAEFARVSTQTVVRFENGDDLRLQTVDRIKNAFKEAGVVFLPDNGSGIGIRVMVGKAAEVQPAISESEKTITGAQVRAARSLIRWSADELATAAQVGVATVRRAEREDGQPSTTAAILTALRTTLETAGIEFIFDDDEGVGVRFRRP